MKEGFKRWLDCEYSLVTKLDKDGYPIEYLCMREELLMGKEIRLHGKITAAVLSSGGNPRENKKIRKALSKSCKKCKHFKKRE